MFHGQVRDIEDLERDPYEMELVGYRYRVIGETPKHQEFIFFTDTLHEVGEMVKVQADDAEWNGTFWQLSGAA